MNYKIIRNHWIFKLPFMRGFYAITIGHNILIKSISLTTTQLNHELIHIEQIERHGVAKFYLLYMFYWIKNLFKYRNLKEAYLNNPFELEAYIMKGHKARKRKFRKD